MDTDRCTAQRADGAPCRGLVRAGKTECAFHDPELAETRRAASAQGGRNKATEVRAYKMVPAHMRTLMEALMQDIVDVREGRLKTQQAIAVAQLVNAAVRVFEVGVLAARLADVEGKVNDDDNTY